MYKFNTLEELQEQAKALFQYNKCISSIFTQDEINRLKKMFQYNKCISSIKNETKETVEMIGVSIQQMYKFNIFGFYVWLIATCFNTTNV